jgi:protein-arginine kinase activator protein McsA
MTEASMKCERCGERDAVVHFASIKNTETRTLLLCQICADNTLGQGVPGALRRQFEFLTEEGRQLTDEELDAIRRFSAAMEEELQGDKGQSQMPPPEDRGEQ